MMCFFMSSCANCYIDDNATHLWRHGYNVKNLCRCRQVRMGPNNRRKIYCEMIKDKIYFIEFGYIFGFQLSPVSCCIHIGWENIVASFLRKPTLLADAAPKEETLRRPWCRVPWSQRNPVFSLWRGVFTEITEKLWSVFIRLLIIWVDLISVIQGYQVHEELQPDFR